MFVTIDGEDAVSVLVLQAKGDLERLVLHAVPRHVFAQDLVVPVVPVQVMLNSGGLSPILLMSQSQVIIFNLRLIFLCLTFEEIKPTNFANSVCTQEGDSIDISYSGLSVNHFL